MGNCLKKKNNSVELRTNNSENTNKFALSGEKVKHKVKNIVRAPQKT